MTDYGRKKLNALSFIWSDQKFGNAKSNKFSKKKLPVKKSLISRHKRERNPTFVLFHLGINLAFKIMMHWP